jgi:hypothetical protein
MGRIMVAALKFDPEADYNPSESHLSRVSVVAGISSAGEGFIREENPKTYRTLVDGRLMRVLNEGVVLRRGYSVEGLLCGISFQPVPESANHYVTAKLTLADDIGNSVAVRLVFTIV